MGPSGSLIHRCVNVAPGISVMLCSPQELTDSRMEGTFALLPGYPVAAGCEVGSGLVDPGRSSVAAPKGQERIRLVCRCWTVAFRIDLIAGQGRPFPSSSNSHVRQ